MFRFVADARPALWRHQMSERTRLRPAGQGDLGRWREPPPPRRSPPGRPFRPVRRPALPPRRRGGRGPQRRRWLAGTVVALGVRVRSGAAPAPAHARPRGSHGAQNEPHQLWRSEVGPRPRPPDRRHEPRRAAGAARRGGPGDAEGGERRGRDAHRGVQVPHQRRQHGNDGPAPGPGDGRTPGGVHARWHLPGRLQLDLDRRRPRIGASTRRGPRPTSPSGPL